MIADLAQQEFMQASWAQESRRPDWRSLFLCSAFLVQATRPTSTSMSMFTNTEAATAI